MSCVRAPSNGSPFLSPDRGTEAPGGKKRTTMSSTSRGTERSHGRCSANGTTGNHGCGGALAPSFDGRNAVVDEISGAGRGLSSELLTAYGPCGQEDAVRDICRRELEPLVDEASDRSRRQPGGRFAGARRRRSG